MSSEWNRKRPISVVHDTGRELWVSPDGREFDISSKYGNPLDIVGLKSDILEGLSERVQEIRATRTDLYASENVEPVLTCPVCGASSGESDLHLTIYRAQYHQCRGCGHAYVNPRPTSAAVDAYYASSVDYSATYTDVEKAMQRVRGIAEPRVRWMTAVYEETYGRKPRTILDVGAGGGHFVRACLDAGYEAKGLEVSEPSRVFARNHFEIELLSEDFTNPAFDAGRPDIITFWGVIEHVTDPASLVEATARHLSEEGIVIAGVPKFNSVDTMIQTLCNDTVVRHLDPLGHINCFSENSLLTLFDRFAFDPASVWYFGMDAYEVLVQCGLRSEDPGFFERIKAAIPLLQQAIDRAALSDEVTLALRPR